MSPNGVTSWPMFLLFFLFCSAQLPICYLAAGLFHSPSTAYSLLLSITILTGILPTYYYMALFVSSQDHITLRPVLESAGQWMLLMPAFGLGKGLSDIVRELNIGQQSREFYGSEAEPPLKVVRFGRMAWVATIWRCFFKALELCLCCCYWTIGPCCNQIGCEDCRVACPEATDISVRQLCRMTRMSLQSVTD